MMEVLKKVKRKLSVVLAAAMVLTSITIPNATVVKADTPTIKDVIHSVAGQTSWDDDTNTIVLDRSEGLSIFGEIGISVNNVSYVVSVNEVPFVSGNAVEKLVTAELFTGDFSEQTDTFDVTMTDGEGNQVLNDTLTVILKAKEAKVAPDYTYSSEAGTISVKGRIDNYKQYNPEQLKVGYKIYPSPCNVESITPEMFKEMQSVTVGADGAFSFTAPDFTPGNYDVVVATQAGCDDHAVYSKKVFTVPVIEKPIEEPYINVNFQSLDGKEIYEDESTVPFNDINVVVSANNVPEDAKVTLKAYIPASPEAQKVVLVSKELVVSGNKVNATEPIKMPEDAFGKTIKATVKIEDAKGTSLASDSKSVFVKGLKVKYKVLPTGALSKYDIINKVVKLDYDEQYKFIVEYGGDEVAITKAEPLYSENSYMTVSGNYAYFKSLAKDAGKNFSYKVSAKIEGKEVVIGNINIELMRNYTITINGDKKKFTVSGNKAEQNKYQYEYKEGTMITPGDLEIIANKGYLISAVKINGSEVDIYGYKYIPYSVESYSIYQAIIAENNYHDTIDKNYVIDVTTVAVNPKKADVLFSINEEKELKSNATINCGDFICGTAFKDGVNISTSANIILKEKKGSKYEKVTGADLTAYGFEYWSHGDGYGQIAWNVLNAASGKQFQIVVQDEKHTYATYNLKVSKIAEKILVDKKAEKEFKVEAGKEITVNLSGDGYVQRYDVSENAVLYPDKVEFKSGDNGKGTFYVYPGAEGEYKFKLYGFVNGYQSVSPAAVTIKVEKPAWVDKDVVVSRSDKYTSYENLGFVASLKEKNKYKMKAGDTFTVRNKEYTYKWEYTVSGNEAKKADTDEVDLGVRPSGTEVTAKLVLVDKNDHVVYQSKLSETAKLELRKNLKTEKIGFKKKSSAAYTEHAVELATLTYDKNTGRTLSDYYDVRLYDQNGDIIIESGNKAYDKLAVWLEDGSLVVYAPCGTEGKKFTAEVYADAGKDSKDADVVAKTTFTVKKSIESIKNDTIKVFKKENKALKVSLKPVFNVGDKAPASKKVSYAFENPEDVPSGVTLKGNTITIAKDARVYYGGPIGVTVTAEDVKDKNKKITGTITVNVKTSASNAAAVYVAESLGNAYKPVNKLVAGKEYSVILAKETNQDILYEKDLVDAFTYTTDKSITKNAFTITPTVAKKNVKITATAYDGVKKTTKVDVENKELPSLDKISIIFGNYEFDAAKDEETISINTTSADTRLVSAAINGQQGVLPEYGLTVKVSGMKYIKGMGYAMTSKTASIKVMNGRTPVKTLTINNMLGKLEKAPNLKANKKFTVVNAANKDKAANGLNTVTITPASGYVSDNVAGRAVLFADKKTWDNYHEILKVGPVKSADGSFTISLDDNAPVPAGNVKLNVYYTDKDGKPLTNPKTITIPVQKMKYSFKLSSGIRFGKEAVSTNVVAKYDSNAVQSVDTVEVQNAFKKGTGKYNTFATIFNASAFDMDNKSFALNITDGKAGTLSDILSSRDKDIKANKNGVIKVKVTYKDGAVRYYTTKVTVSQAKK